MIWIGALLIIGGVVYTAIQPIMQGRLSRVRRVSPVRPGNTLEPERPARGFGLDSNWPGLAMIGLGALVLLTWAIF
jgi:hypothetical protein